MKQDDWISKPMKEWIDSVAQRTLEVAMLNMSIKGFIFRIAIWIFTGGFVAGTLTFIILFRVFH